MESRTLAERIGAAEPPVVPPDRDGVTWRAPSISDIDGITRAHDEMSAVDHPEWSPTREEFEDEFGHSWVNPETDMLIAEYDGAIVAYGHVAAPPDPESVFRVFLHGGVVPRFRGRGLGSELLSWQRARGKHMLASAHIDMPGWLMSSADTRTPDASRLLEKHGLTPARWFTSLERNLTASLPEPRRVEGIVIDAPTDADEEEVRRSRNESFRDHWGSQPHSPELWHSFWTTPTFAPALSRVARDGERIVGFVLLWVTPEDFERQGFVGGYIGLVGVEREWRRRGLAAAMLIESMHAARASGHEGMALDVDGDSPTGALGLYTQLGFVPRSGSVTHVAEF